MIDEKHYFIGPGSSVKRKHWQNFSVMDSRTICISEEQVKCNIKCDILVVSGINSQCVV